MTTVLIAEDEPLMRERLVTMLALAWPEARIVLVAENGNDAWDGFLEHEPQVVFLDIRMRGLDGVVLGRLLAQFARPPRVVFVTAYEEHAVDAFEIKAEDYLLKPVRPERLAEAVRRVWAATREAADPDRQGRSPVEADTIPVELGGVTRFVSSSDVRYVEAQGDYARLHTSTGSHLVRIPLAVLEDRWANAGFVRVHRSHLVSLKHIDELHLGSGRCTVRIGDTEIPVSRRHTRQLRDLLVRRARPGRGE